MASIFSVGVSKVSGSGCLVRLCKVPKHHNVAQVAFLTRVSNQEPRKKPAPFPYWKKSYTFFHQCFDPLTYRFDDNTKLLVVDGLPAVGKSKFCEKIAKEFGLLYMPNPIHEECYINKYGVDLRELDPKLPLRCRSFDTERFCQNPNDPRTPFLQLRHFLMRYEQYVNALLHILSTGQGVVLDRCVYSDIVFVKAMVNAGYLKKDMLKLYNHIRQIGFEQILKPHLIIYLDAPVEVIKDKIKQRGIPYEVNSKLFTTEYLSDIQKSYKEDYLKELTNHTPLLVYDWSKEGNYSDVCDEMEELVLENRNDGKLEDWVFCTTADLISLRRALETDIFQTYCKMYQDTEEVDWPNELIWSPDEDEAMEKVFSEVPSEVYEHGFNPLMKDKVLFKVPTHELYSFRRTPRDFINRNEQL